MLPTLHSSAPSTSPVPTSSVSSHIHRQQQPLTAVALVCAAHDGLSTLAPLVSAFIDPIRFGRWSIERGCERGYLSLLQRLVDVNFDAHKPTMYRAHAFSRALAHAVAHDNDLALLTSLRLYYSDGSVVLGMDAAARLGKLHVMQWLAIHYESTITWSAQFTQTAAGAGHLDIVQWLATKSALDADDICSAATAAVDSGHLAVVQWLLERADHFRDEEQQRARLLAAACSSGSIAIVRYLISDCGFHLAPTEPTCLSRAVAAGHLALAQWLDANGHCGISSLAIRDAMANDHVEVVHWLVAHDLVAGVIYTYHLKHAVDFAHFEVAKVIYALDRRVFSSKMLAAKIPSVAHSGDIAFLKWLVALRDADDEPVADSYARDAYSALDEAATQGHFEIVTWVFTHLRSVTPSQHIAWTERWAVTEAVRNGHGAIAKWLHASRIAGAPVPVDSSAIATECSRLELMQWTLQVCAEYPDAPSAVVESAVASGDLPVLQWLHAHVGFDAMYWPSRVLADAVQHDHVHIVQWLDTYGCSVGWYDALMDNAMSLAMVAWLHAHHYTDGCSTDATDNAAARGDFDTLLFLHAHRREGCSARAAERALANGHTHVAQWLLVTYPYAMTAVVDGDEPVRL